MCQALIEMSETVSYVYLSIRFQLVFHLLFSIDPSSYLCIYETSHKLHVFPQNILVLSCIMIMRTKRSFLITYKRAFLIINPRHNVTHRSCRNNPANIQNRWFCAERLFLARSRHLWWRWSIIVTKQTLFPLGNQEVTSQWNSGALLAAHHRVAPQYRFYLELREVCRQLQIFITNHFWIYEYIIILRF